MSTLVARDIHVSFGAVAVLHGVGVVVGPQTRLGLVGPNGAGKTTLLRVLASELEPDSGSVVSTGTVGYLPQEPDRRTGETLHAYLARRTGVADADAALQRTAAALHGGGPDTAVAYDAALQRWLDLGGADLDTRAEAVCAELGLDEQRLMTTDGLSGGQLARAALAAVLLNRYDVIVLDEPTNDLDLDGLERLEDFVAGLRGGLVVVSHDREFLARTVTDVLELDPANKRSRTFAGGWDAYLDERETVRRQARERYEQHAQQRAELAARVQSTREMSVRGAVRAKRRAPDNDRSARGARIEAATSAASKVKSLETRLARLDALDVVAPRKEWQLHLNLPAAARSGDLVSSARGAVVRRGDFTLGPVDVDLWWGDRVALLGPNGGGKTTLIQALLGRIPLDAGSVRLGASVVVGELDQARRDFGGPRTVVDVLTDQTGLPSAEARTLLAKFGLDERHVERPSGSLSPGERTRSGLALLMARGTNCLVLDEPTNHLDLPAIEQLEAAVTTYAGTLVLVSHDRRLLAAVPTTRRWHVATGQVSEE